MRLWLWLALGVALPRTRAAVTCDADACASGTRSSIFAVPGKPCGYPDHDEYPSEFGRLPRSLARFVRQIENDKCARQLVAFTDALGNSSLWAVQMIDSSAKPSEVLHNSDTYQLGHFDECVGVNLRRKRDNIYGKYCLVEVKVKEFGRNREGKSFILKERFRRFGVCVPNECLPEDVETTLQSYYDEVLVADATALVRVHENGCATSESKPEKPSAKFLRYKVLGLGTVVVLITLVDLLGLRWGTFTELWHQTTEIFSCHRNLRKLTDVKEGRLPGAHFLRVATICVLVMYRRYQLLVEGPLKNQSHFEVRPPFPGPIVDALIFLCGFLTTSKLVDEPDIASKRKFFRMCAARWLRLMPLYVVTVGFYASTFDATGSGPLWVERIGTESKRCRDVWWANLSFINNYISASRQCITQSWYLSVIVHCSFVTLIFMHLRKRRSHLGLASLGLLLATFMVLFVWNDYAFANTQLTRGAMDLDEIFRDFYIKTHNRAPSYAIGVVTALLYNDIQRTKDGITRVQIVLTSFLFTTFGLITVISKSTSSESDLESRLLFAATSSLSWSLLLGCLAVATAICRASTFAPNKHVFIPLSRLSYPVLLVHDVIQLHTVGVARAPEFLTLPRLVWMGLADILSSFALAVVLHLVIEAPTISAIKAVLSSKDESNDPEKVQPDGDDLRKK